MRNEVPFEEIQKFLAGNNDCKYIVAVEVPYNTDYANVVINDPESGKRIEKHKYTPFLWMKHSVTNQLYGGNRGKIMAAMQKYGIKITALKTTDPNGFEPERMKNGFKYLVQSSKSQNDLTNFFKDGGIDIYKFDDQRTIYIVKPEEQFFISTSKRLFKGFDDYDQLHRFQFDLETEGLNPKFDGIFQIGIRDNRGFELILETEGNTPTERRESERNNIIKFFYELAKLAPDVICGYNSESFDWEFIYQRCEVLSLIIEKYGIGLDGLNKIKRKNNTLKLGEETEKYLQTYLWGYNIIDTSHAVRRAQKINTDIEEWNLKYITKYSKINKKNRVYVDGSIIHTTWADKENDYYLNDANGDWFKYSDNKLLIEKLNSHEYQKVTGDYIVKRYLMDDLWETDKVDYIYSQATFLISKILPTSYMRTATMGTAGQWSLMMAAWSYENNLAIPDFKGKEDFTGGLSRQFRTGYSKKSVKFDYAGLYPKTTLTYDVFPDLDISGAMKGLLKYIVEQRDTFKFLKEEYELKASLAEGDDVIRYTKMASDYDKKQLPLKILANSFFGSYGASYIFAWGDISCAERVTCLSRQNLRLMVDTFKMKFGFTPMVGDTDGFNFETPENLNFKYTPKRTHWKTEKYEDGLELDGVEGCLAWFNEEHMPGWMGLDIDEYYDATINFKRKNYATMKRGGKIKLVGASIKNKNQPIYIKEFLKKGIELLLKGEGYDFYLYYRDYVKKIANYQIPVAKIANRPKVKESIDEYKKYCSGKDKNGKPNARKAHMELCLENGIEPKLGDLIYFVNTGKTKSKGDVTIKKDKNTGERSVTLNCEIIPTVQIEENPEYTVDYYNAPKYVEKLNSILSKTVLVCFDKGIRDRILVNMVLDKKLKEYVLQDGDVFTEEDCKLVSGQPLSPDDQDDYIERFMLMEDKEIKYWLSTRETPLYMSDDEWELIKESYKHRKENEKHDGLISDRQLIDNICSKLTEREFNKMRNDGIIPSKILLLADIDIDKGVLISRKWGGIIGDLDMLFSYEKALKRESEFKKIVGDDCSWDNMLTYLGEYKPSNIDWSDDLYDDILLLVKQFGYDYIMREFDVYTFWTIQNDKLTNLNVVADPILENQVNILNDIKPVNTLDSVMLSVKSKMSNFMVDDLF